MSGFEDCEGECVIDPCVNETHRRAPELGLHGPALVVDRIYANVLHTTRNGSRCERFCDVRRGSSLWTVDCGSRGLALGSSSDSVGSAVPGTSSAGVSLPLMA